VRIVLRLLAFVLPLGLDSFAVAAALGALSPSRRERWRIAALFVAFEAGMPLVGVAIGAPIAHVVAGVADYVAAAALVAVGGWMLLSGDEDAEEERVRRLSKSHGLAVIGLGIGISLDELAIGFGLWPGPPVDHGGGRRDRGPGVRRGATRAAVRRAGRRPDPRGHRTGRCGRADRAGRRAGGGASTRVAPVRWPGAARSHGHRLAVRARHARHVRQDGRRRR